MLLGAVIATTLTLVATAGALASAWWLVVACAMLLVSGTFLLVLDAARRLRYLPNRIRHVVRKATPPRKAPKQAEPAATAAPPTQQDVIGTVRVLQAQYLGRLDRLQGDVEEALAALRALTGGAAGSSDVHINADNGR